MMPDLDLRCGNIDRWEKQKEVRSTQRVFFAEIIKLTR
jgi:hypothetical protein